MPKISLRTVLKMNERMGVPPNNEGGMSASFDRPSEGLSVRPPAVIIVGPPWPRSGTARVIQNQIHYYRERGFFTLFIAVPFHWNYMKDSVVWTRTGIKEGIDELGADCACTALLEQKRYNVAKFKASVRYGFRGTVLDWQVEIGRAARLPDEDIDFLGGLRAALLHVNHVYTLGFALDLRKQVLSGGSRLPIILETHDVQSHALQQRGDLNPWTRRPDRLERLIESETALLEKANVLVHLSVDDFKFFQARLPSKLHSLAFPTIDENFGSSVDAVVPPAEIIDVLFVGASHIPNFASVKWFFDQVWPLIVDRRYNLKIVGPVGSMVQWQSPQLYETFRSCFVGEVADLAPFYRAARCVMAPMVSGSGISIKTIEALAQGKPFVGTSMAFRGMPMDDIQGAGLCAYDEPRAFADAIVHTLANQDKAAAASRVAYHRVFSKEASFASRDEAFRSALKI